MKTFITAAVLAAGLALTACNTVEGAGKDIKSAGNAIEDTAQDVKK
jgi:predicted small secreted protein